MIIIVTGDRNYKKMNIIENELKKFPKDTVVKHGAARGADTLAAFIADRLGMQVIPFPAKWHIYGRGAGPVRNQEMLDDRRPGNNIVDEILAFHDNIVESAGTKDMINRGVKAGIKVTLFENGMAREIKRQIK